MEDINEIKAEAMNRLAVERRPFGEVMEEAIQNGLTIFTREDGIVSLLTDEEFVQMYAARPQRKPHEKQEFLFNADYQYLGRQRQ